MLTIVDDRNLGYALGAADYLTKPIDRERLAAVLDASTGATAAGAGRGRRRRRPRSCCGGCWSTEGWTVVEAENGRAALERAARRAARR